jgi:hypothetical protein
MTITSQATTATGPCLQQPLLLVELPGRTFTATLKLPGNEVAQTDDPSLYIITPPISLRLTDALPIHPATKHVTWCTK